jgi:tripartite-type tricarboxylate transporter receptor subunit TctC
VATADWNAARERLGWEATYRFGAEFAKFVNDEDVSYQGLLKELGFLK